MEAISELIFNKFIRNSKRYKSIDKEYKSEARHMLLGNFDLYYIYTFFNLLKPIDPKFNFVLFLHYVSIFHDREEKIDFCIKIIRRVEIDKEGFFKETPSGKKGLINIFKVELESLEFAKKSSPQDHISLEILEKYDNIIKELTKLSLNQEEQLNYFLERDLVNKRKGRRKILPLTYEDIFVEKHYGSTVKKLLKDNGFLKESGEWQGETGKSNELAVLFYLLKLPKHSLCIIRNSDNKNRIIAFYHEFGLKVDIQGETGGYCTYGNIAQESHAIEIRAKFKLIFTPQTLKIP